MSSAGWWFDSGSLNAAGTIAWATETHLNPSKSYILGAEGGPSVIVDTNGRIWVSLIDQAAPGLEIWRCASSCGTASNWSDNHNILNWTGICAQLIPLTSGKIAVVYTEALCTNDKYYVQTYDGSSSWSTAVATSAKYDLAAAQLAALGDTVEACGFLSNTPVYYFSFAYGTSAWSSPVGLASSSGPPTCATATDGKSSISVTTASGNGMSYYMSTSAGIAWSNPVVFDPGESGWGWMSGPLTFSSSVSAVWESGTSSPYKVRYFMLPITMPTAANTKYSWGKLGLSPYESYFQNLGEFLSTGNGLLTEVMGTASVPGRGLNLETSLVYTNAYTFRPSGSVFRFENFTSAKLGAGWALDLPWLGTSYVHMPGGEAIIYSWIGSNMTYLGDTDFTLINGSGGYTLTMKDGTQYSFNSARQLTQETDHTGNNTLTFSYGGNGYLSSITDPLNRQITFGYNANNYLTTITSAGRTWTLSYSSTSPPQLVSVTDPLNRVTTFHYKGTSGANLWLLGSIRYPTGGNTTYVYGSMAYGTEASYYYVTGRNVYSSPTQLARSDSISYTAVNAQITWSNMTTSNGVNVQGYTRTNYDPSSGTQVVYNLNSAGTVFKVTENDYDGSGRVATTKLESPSRTVLSNSTSGFDNWGNVISTKDFAGEKTYHSYANTNSYNSFGGSGCSTAFYPNSVSPTIHNALVGTCTFQNGAGSAQQDTFYKYDKRGNLLEKKVSHNSGWLYTDHTYDRYGNILSTTDANGHTTYYRYSSTYGSAYLTKQSILVGTQNVTTYYTYDSAKGFKLSMTDPNGQTTNYQYDGLGRQTQITYPAIGGVSAQKNYAYDDIRSRITITDEDGHVTNETFDGLARMTSVVRLNGTAVYSTETFTYNWLNLVAADAKPSSNTYTYSYDSLGRLTETTNPDTTYSTTSYDDVNNLKTVTDENGHRTIYAYNWNGWLISVKEYNSSSTYYLTTYSYDLSGNLLSATDAKHQQTGYQYDDLNRLITTTFPTSPSTTETETYDSVGNMLTRTTANNSQISYNYDALNRLVKIHYPGSGGNVTYTYDADGNKLTMVNPWTSDYYTYDARDRVTNATEVVGGAKYATLYQYDKASNVAQSTYPDAYALSMTYDGVNRLKKVGTFATLSYTVDDKLSKTTYGDGEVTTYSYDNRDRPTQILDKYGTTTEMFLNYTYDGTGNVLTVNGKSESYGYDWLNRLTSSTGPWGTITYSYDQVGNRVKMVQGGTTTYTYGSYNRLSSAGSVSYTYDANGNMITKNDGTSWNFYYDYADRLTKVLHSGTAVQTNSYDGDGNRVKQVAGSGTFTYSYQGLSILYDKNVTGGTTIITKFFYAAGMQMAKMVGTGVYYIHEDALGSTRLVTTSSVTVTFSSNYVPYGNSYGTIGNEVFMYTGEPYDRASGLYLFGARFYDPSVGRFVTEDSYLGSKEDPKSRDRYAYAEDDPEKNRDPSGHMIFQGQEGGTSSDGMVFVPISSATTIIASITAEGTTTTIMSVNSGTNSFSTTTTSVTAEGATTVTSTGTVTVSTQTTSTTTTASTTTSTTTTITVDIFNPRNLAVGNGEVGVVEMVAGLADLVAGEAAIVLSHGVDLPEFYIPPNPALGDAGNILAANGLREISQGWSDCMTKGCIIIIA